MKDFKEARERYEATPIPEELDRRVRAGIRQGRSRYRARRLWRSDTSRQSGTFPSKAARIQSSTLAPCTARTPETQKGCSAHGTAFLSGR